VCNRKLFRSLEIVLQASCSVTLTLSLFCFASTDSSSPPPDCVTFLVLLYRRISLILPGNNFSCYCVNVGKYCRAENKHLVLVWQMPYILLAVKGLGNDDHLWKVTNCVFLGLNYEL
jgi:hypothetical protein